MKAVVSIVFAFFAMMAAAGAFAGDKCPLMEEKIKGGDDAKGCIHLCCNCERCHCQPDYEPDLGDATSKPKPKK